MATKAVAAVLAEHWSETAEHMQHTLVAEGVPSFVATGFGRTFEMVR